MYLDGRGLNTITKAIGQETKREQGIYNQKEGKAVETKVYKLWRGYRGEKPLFTSIGDRSKAPWNERELRLLKTAIKYKRKVKDISILSGRPEEQIQTKINELTNYKASFFKNNSLLTQRK
jgi:hypothetical protein